MMVLLRALSILVLATLSSGSARAEGAWEFLGPGAGTVPDALCVTERALYVGMADGDSAGLGLYRYTFATGGWDLFAWAGDWVTGVVVWGEEDENIVLVRGYGSYSSFSRFMKSTDGGQTWSQQHSAHGMRRGLVQAPADPSHILCTGGFYSTDGGGTWVFSCPDCAIPPYDSAFDPVDPHVAYMLITDSVDNPNISKTTDGGASWYLACYPWCSAKALAVEWSRPAHVIASGGGGARVSTDAGETWTWRPAPFWGTKDACSPRWAPGAFFTLGRFSSVATYGVWQNWDLGETWVECGEGLPPAPEEWTWSLAHIAAHPTEPDLYVALEGSGVWRWRLQGAGVPEAVPDLSGMRLTIQPNPTTRQFTVRLGLPRAETIRLDLIDAGGRLVRRLHEGRLGAGEHALSANGVPSAEAALASGVYHVVLTVPDGRIERRLVVIR